MVDLLNLYGKKREKILFIIDFKSKNFHISPIENLKNIHFDIDGFKNFKPKKTEIDSLKFSKEPISFQEYKKMFDSVIKEIEMGNTYLLNLTSKTSIESNLSIEEIFHISKAKFKLLYRDKFVCFSPERFIKIDNNTISTYPMKGTIDADIPKAKEIILSDSKELAEHTMVVDLLRNDLSMVAKRVRVDEFRYIDKIKAGDKYLLQVSSKIIGDLESNWQERLGDIITKLLPAGSITGTPKIKSTEIIDSIENYERGFFTGIFGYFDGERLDSSVMIRFIEREKKGKLVYKSGGGITIDSNPLSEYQELLNKVYIPT